MKNPRPAKLNKHGRTFEECEYLWFLQNLRDEVGRSENRARALSAIATIMDTLPQNQKNLSVIAGGVNALGIDPCRFLSEERELMEIYGPFDQNPK